MQYSPPQVLTRAENCPALDPPCRCIFLYAQGYPSQNHVRAALDASLLPWAESWVSLGQAMGIRWHQTLPEQQFRASLERCSGLTILIRTKTQSRGLGAGQHPPASPGNIFSPCSSTSSCAGGFQKYPSRGHGWGSSQVQLVWFLLSSVPHFFHAEEGARASSGVQQGAAGFWGRIWGELCLFQRVWGSPSTAFTALCTPSEFQAKSPPTYCMSPVGEAISPCAAPELWREAQRLPLTMCRHLQP